MKNLISAVAFCLVSLISNGQLTINPQLPPIGLTLKSQLWNLSVVNTYGVGFTTQLQLTVTDVSTNQTVFTALSKPLFLPPGAKQIGNGDVQPVSYTGINPSYPVDANPNGFLPVGVFNFCYSVVGQDAHAQRSVDEVCDQAQVEPLSPPMLVNPADSEQVDNSRPMFIWIPPAPGNLFSNISYEYHLVEVQPTQSAADAVQQNIPVLYLTNLHSTNLQYPLSAPALDSNKLYAWQIVAKNNSAPVGTSEAWAFRLKKDNLREKPKLIASSYYSKLSQDPGTAFAVSGGVVHFSYLEEANTKTVHIGIVDITKSKHREVQLDSSEYSVRYGDNLVSLDLRNNSDIVNKHIYLLELTNARQEHWYLRFEYLKQD
jgi:hypothetical protein